MGSTYWKRQVLELAAHFVHAEAMGDRRVNVQRFARNFVLPLRREKLQRAHIVQAVGQLDEDDTNVIHHGQHHLAHVLGLRVFRRGKLNLADLGDAFDDVSDLLAELGFDLVDGHRGVFHHVVQQPAGDRGRVELHLSQNGRHLQRVRQIRLARLARAAFVMFEGEVVGFFHQRQVVGGPIGADLAQKVAVAGNR
jgi:hypothetical protein